MSRFEVLSDRQWAVIEPLLPSRAGCPGMRFRQSRAVEEGIIYRYRTGTPWRDLPRQFGPWRDLPRQFGPWRTVWKRHHRYAVDGTWEKILTAMLAEADAAGLVDWTVSVDSTASRARQHATNTRRPDTGGTIELQGFARRAS